MTTIMPIDEPRPRGTVFGERSDRRRVCEAEHYFRCRICGGFIDARDVAWIEDHEGPLPHPAQDGIQQLQRWPPDGVASASQDSYGKRPASRGLIGTDRAAMYTKSSRFFSICSGGAVLF
jgi:hypothetical protein